MTVKICGKEWDIEEIRKMYENDFDTRKAWCQALGHKQGTHFKQLIKRLGFKEEDFGKNRKNIYKKYIHKDDRFGKLVVIEPDCQKDKYGRQMSLCRCDCGTELIVLDNSLWTQNTTSCGCKSGFNLSNKIKNGDVFTYLTVIDANNYHINKDKILASKCRCICGKEIIVGNKSLRSVNTTSCGCKIRSTGELKIIELLQKYNLIYQEQYSFSELIGKSAPLRFDFAIFNNDELFCLIEFQGEQHYKSKDFFGGEEQFSLQKEYDNKKRQYCLDKGIKLIEIPYYNIKSIEEKYIIPLITAMKTWKEI